MRRSSSGETFVDGSATAGMGVSSAARTALETDASKTKDESFMAGQERRRRYVVPSSLSKGRRNTVHILVLNVGSSSLKFQLIDTDDTAISQRTDRRLARGQIERIGGEAILTLAAGDQPHRTTTVA